MKNGTGEKQTTATSTSEHVSMDCGNCVHCCEYMSFGFSTSNLSDRQIEDKADYFRTRGCKVTAQGTIMVVAVFSPCPQLTKKGCGCYKNRPNLCRVYDCRNDVYLPRGGKYNP
jgi:Fe-S-cluster containining protein